ncbi:tail fiber/spike domain-containing protein [Citrobacter farmeri]|nr:family 43 glycosylhydrolase [Citrobacter farmeri]
MTTYNTGNPLGSAAAKDLYDNAQNFDHLSDDRVNEIWPDRFGVPRLTWHGMEQRYKTALANLGLNPVGTFQGGSVINSAGDIIQDESTGVWYRWDDLSTLPKMVPAGSTPDSTGGIGDGKWVVVDVSDVLRKDLEKTTGAGMIGTLDGGTVEDLTFIKENKKIFVSVFFDPSTQNVYLSTSIDGINWSGQAGLKLEDGSPLRGRDPSICYFADMWWIAVTQATVNADVRIFRSKDLISWTSADCKFGSGVYGNKVEPSATANAIYNGAPEFFIDGSGLYILNGFQYGPNVPDAYSGSIPDCRVYYAKMTSDPDVSVPTFEWPTRFSLSTANDQNRIDASLVSYDGALWLAVKNEYNKTIDLWKSTTGISGTFQFLSTAPSSGFRVEGPSLVRRENDWILYVDDFYNRTGIYYNTSYDLIAWGNSTVKPLSTLRDTLAHGTVMHSIFEGEQVYQLLTLMQTQNSWGSPKRTIKEIYVPIGPTTIVPEEDTIYYTTGTIIATVNIEANRFSAKTARFMVSSENPVCAIKFTGSGFRADPASLTIGYGRHMGTVCEFYLDVDKYVIGARPDRPQPGSVSLRTEAGGSTISNWRPVYGRTYTTNASDTGITTISSMPVDMPDGHMFYLLILSPDATNGSVSFVSGTSIWASVTLNGTNYNGKPVQVIKVGGRWSVLGL